MLRKRHQGIEEKPEMQRGEKKSSYVVQDVRVKAYVSYEETYEEAVPRPIMKKLPARILKEDSDGFVILPGVFAISAAMIAKLDEKRHEASREQVQGPYSSMILPRKAENGY